MKRWIIILPLMIIALALSLVIFINGCSTEEDVVFRTVEANPPPQILVGVDLNRFVAAFPNANLEALLFRAIDFRITFYGDDVYAPKWTGSGLSFNDPDRIVPKLLAHKYGKDLWFWFPVNDHSTDKLQATYDHWKAKGWLNAATWFFFLPGVSDEVRNTDEIIRNNLVYAEYKARYPEIKWMVTREISQFNPNVPRALADVYLPMFHMFEVEKAYLALTSSCVNMAYSGVTLGGYISGYTDDPQSMEPGWYFSTWKRYFSGEAPNVPVLTMQDAGDILDYCETPGMKFFLFWDILGLLDNVNGTPKPKNIVIKLLGY